MYLKYSYINTVTFIWQINDCFYIYCQTKLYFLSKKDCWDFFLFPAVIFPYFFALTKYPPVNNKNLDHLSGFYISPPVFNIGARLHGLCIEIDMVQMEQNRAERLIYLQSHCALWIQVLAERAVTTYLLKENMNNIELS